MTSRIVCENCGAESFADGAKLVCHTCYFKALATLEKACFLIDSGYLQDPDWEQLNFEQKMQSKQTLFYEQAKTILTQAQRNNPCLTS